MLVDVKKVGRLDVRVSINQLAYLCGVYALRIVGAHNMAPPNKQSRISDAGPRSHR